MGIDEVDIVLLYKILYSFCSHMFITILLCKILALFHEFNKVTVI